VHRGDCQCVITLTMNLHECLNAAFQWATLRPMRPDVGEGHVEDHWVDGWIRQQQRVKDALAAVRRGRETTAHAKAADEWVDGWIRQQERLRKAFALARQTQAPHPPAEANDEWVDGWVRQQQTQKILDRPLAAR
jgi:hypothetical protein